MNYQWEYIEPNVWIIHLKIEAKDIVSRIGRHIEIDIDPEFPIPMKRSLSYKPLVKGVEAITIVSRYSILFDFGKIFDDVDTQNEIIYRLELEPNEIEIFVEEDM